MKTKLHILNIISILLIIGLIFGMLFIEKLNNARYLAAERLNIEDKLYFIRSRLEGQVLGDIHLVKGMLSVIAANPNLQQATFTQAAKPIFQTGGAHLRNIGAAPKDILSMIYPLAGNEKAIGLDFKTVPTQFISVERARITRQLVLDGPVPLVQGGNGLIARFPVYLHNGDEEDYYWGQVSTVIDADGIFADSGLVDSESPLAIALKTAASNESQEHVFLGDPTIFQKQPVLADVSLPQGKWVIAAMPRNGWPNSADNATVIRIGFAVLALLLLGPFMFIRRSLESISKANMETEFVKQQLTATLENSPNVAVQWYDPLGRVRYWNHASELIYGWRAEEMLGNTVNQAATNKLVTMFKDIMESNAPIGPIEHQCLHRAGHSLTISRTLFEIPGHEIPIFVCMDVDITQQKKAEHDALIAQKQAEAANLAKSKFLTHMSHELRTPLNAIIGFAQILQMDVAHPLQEQQQQAVAHIMSSGHHLLTLIDEVLDLARIESDQLHINFEDIDLAELLREVRSVMQPFAATHGITMSDVRADGSLSVTADTLRLRQVLLNLVSNAIKYNTAGGKVSFSVERISNEVHIIITDTGIGVEEAHKAEMFKPFQRLGAEDKKIEGTGIGLVVCKRLVEAMNGRIGFDSIVGLGSRFWVALPCAQTQTKPATVAPQMTTPAVITPFIRSQSSASVLYIEDNPLNVSVMQHVFKLLDELSLVTADSAEAGLLAIKQQLPALILLDINLPGMSGFELLHRLKQDPLTAAIPVIAVSAAAMPEDVNAGLEAGFQAYVTKPFKVPALVSLIRSYFN
ncbi:MAG: ATP-binding protein [Methylovulum sp.]